MKDQFSSRTEKIFSVIKILMLTVVFLLAGVMLSARFHGPVRLLAVASGSMEPTIPTHALIIVTPASEYHVGDIITFSKNSKRSPITHRIISVSTVDGETRYVTRGDANNAPDQESVSLNMVVGKYRWHVAGLGRIVSATQTPSGVIGVIVIPSTLLIYDEANKIRRELIRRRKNAFSWSNATRRTPDVPLDQEVRLSVRQLTKEAPVNMKRKSHTRTRKGVSNHE